MPKRQADAYESDGGFVEDVPSGKKARKVKEIKKREGKQEIDRSLNRDDNGDAYWELSKTRRVTLSNFKGKEMINIREYYTSPDGKELPGKKGISLPMDQYAALLAALPDIERQLIASGIDVPRPQYDHDVDQHDGDDDRNDEQKPSAQAPQRKSNIEETSDEDE